MRVCYFGAYDPTYARNYVIRKGLEANGVKVQECWVSPSLQTIERYRALLWRFNELKVPLSALIVAEVNHYLVPLARYLSRKKGNIPLIFDPFISLYDTAVRDRQIISDKSPRAFLYYWADKISMQLADHLLADTAQHKEYYISAFGVEREKIEVVPIGAPDDIFHPFPPKLEQDNFKVIFWGSFIPLHGIEYIVEAAAILQARGEDIDIELIGAGQTFNAMKSLAKDKALSNVKFKGRVALEALPSLIAEADLCLGIFGHTPKASRVVPNKVYEALAMRMPVITGDTPAIREFFEHGRHLFLVPMADPKALAEGILELKGDRVLRSRLAEGGYEVFRENFAPRQIGQKVKQLLEDVE